MTELTSDLLRLRELPPRGLLSGLTNGLLANCSFSSNTATMFETVSRFAVGDPTLNVLTELPPRGLLSGLLSGLEYGLLANCSFNSNTATMFETVSGFATSPA